MASNPPTPAHAHQLSPDERGALLELARSSIAGGIAGERCPGDDLDAFPPALRLVRACFVTLEHHGELRGCIGTLSARRPLATEVAHMARSAAFEDPRFPPVSSGELGGLTISISVLSEPTPLAFGSEAELLEQLRPGQDGLILRDGLHTGTFLPSVWDKLPERADFWRQLKRKAGLRPDHWSETLQVERYVTESFSER